MKFFTKIIMLLITSSCTQRYYYDDVIGKEVAKELRNLRIQRDRYDMSYEEMKRRVRYETREYSICKKVLASLKKRSEKLSEESWHECENGPYFKKVESINVSI